MGVRSVWAAAVCAVVLTGCATWMAEQQREEQERQAQMRHREQQARIREQQATAQTRAQKAKADRQKQDEVDAAVAKHFATPAPPAPPQKNPQQEEAERVANMRPGEKMEWIMRRMGMSEKDEMFRKAMVLRRKCEKQWPDDDRMQDHCLSKQTDALMDMILSGNRANNLGVSNRIYQRIQRKCAGGWPDDFEMREYCEKKQAAAARKLMGVE